MKGVGLQYPEKRSQRSFLQRHLPERAGAGGETGGGTGGHGRSCVVLNKEPPLVSVKHADSSEMNPRDESSDDNDTGDKTTVIVSKKDGGLPGRGGRAQRRGMAGDLSKTGIPRARGCTAASTITKTPRLTSTSTGEGQRDEFPAGNRNEKEMNNTSKSGSSSRLIVLSTHSNNNNKSIDPDDWEMTRIPSLSEAREIRSGGRRPQDGEPVMTRRRKEGELMRGGTYDREAATGVYTTHRHAKSNSGTKDGDGCSRGVTEGHIANHDQTTRKTERKKNEEGEGSRLSSCLSQTDKMHKMRDPHFFSNTNMEVTTSDAQEDRQASRQEEIERDRPSVLLNGDNSRQWSDNHSYDESSSGRSGCGSDGMETGTPSSDFYDTRVYDERGRRQNTWETHEKESPSTDLTEEEDNSNNRQEDRKRKTTQDDDESALSSSHRGHPSSYSSYQQRGRVSMKSFSSGMYESGHVFLPFLAHGEESGRDLLLSYVQTRQGKNAKPRQADTWAICTQQTKGESIYTKDGLFS